MFRSAFIVAVLAALLPAAATAEQLPLRFVTVDGAWDCAHTGGGPLGTIVVADKTYAFLDPSGKVAGYGKLFRVGEAEYDLPHFVFVDGVLKDGLGFAGTTMRGPRGDAENFAKGIFLVLVKSDHSEAECTRRVAP
jgi:hypothetical protein